MRSQPTTIELIQGVVVLRILGVVTMLFLKPVPFGGTSVAESEQPSFQTVAAAHVRDASNNPGFAGRSSGFPAYSNDIKINPVDDHSLKNIEIIIPIRLIICSINPPQQKASKFIPCKDNHLKNKSFIDIID